MVEATTATGVHCALKDHAALYTRAYHYRWASDRRRP